MTFPWTLHIGSATILLHVVLETLAFIVGFRYFLFLRKRQGDLLPDANRTWIILAATFGALLGSRLLGALENPAAWSASPHPLVYLYENKTVLGGLLGGLACVEAVKKMIGERKASGDLFVYPLLLALIIGRIGCFSMGVYEETYGQPTTLPWGLDLGDGLLRHPVALYEIACCIILWMTLRRAQLKNALANGARFKIFLASYCLFRLLLDFIKPRHALFLGLSSIQLGALLGLIHYLPYIVRPKKLTAAHA